MIDETTLTSRITQQYAGRSLIDFLSGRFRYRGREEWAALIAAGKVVVNGSASDADRPLAKGDLVAYTILLEEPPVDGNIAILHDEESFLVADKPGNLPAHADGRFIKNTFIWMIRERYAAQGFAGKLNLVHRLDRETSGVMLVSKIESAHRGLMRQFGAGTVEKEYRAIVRGVVAADAFEVGGYIVPDRASGISIKKRVVDDEEPGAKRAVTRFEVIERLERFTLLRCVPLTGRTNQIRVHLAHAGYPIAGDKLYGRTDEEFLAYVHAVKAGEYDPRPWLEAPRHLLHAARLSFDHPVTRERLCFEAPVPEDMRRFIFEAGSSASSAARP
ncbi:MAG TPA: RluA family pseudouridine synthase [Spirochaetota bacterium]|nr:RluA family pseudouridine synthase [Spirochaetota bacterium]HPI22732.1 RluA family pseudouridine synthase [Spirochaetota bacterium]HPU90442.1 RluA family pseudouridine synthase [Spirochaetota bacterium]